jgi:sigma-B regulation protein RsbU (phosphoserine phosphatase)
MAEVNRIIAESGAPSDIVTLWVGMLEIEEGRIVYANGGHPPALLRHHDDGKIVRLDPTGPLLGAVASAEYTEESAEMSACDVVLLYTDGVTEARREGRFFGEGRVRRALSYGGTPDDVTSRLLAALDRFAPGDLRDDAAVLAVRVREEAELASFGASSPEEDDGENEA